AANAGFVEWEGCRISVIDTPGDGNFWGAANRALHVVDSAIITVSALDGVEPITARVAAELSERGVPCAVFVTKLDKESASFEQTLAEIRGDMAKTAVALSLPMGEGPAFKGVVSLLSEKAY